MRARQPLLELVQADGAGEDCEALQVVCGDALPLVDLELDRGALEGCLRQGVRGEGGGEVVEGPNPPPSLSGTVALARRGLRCFLLAMAWAREGQGTTCALHSGLRALCAQVSIWGVPLIRMVHSRYEVDFVPTL